MKEKEARVELEKLYHSIQTGKDVAKSLKDIRAIILTNPGIPENEGEAELLKLPRKPAQTLRCKLWKLFLNVPKLDVEKYISHAEEEMKNEESIQIDIVRCISKSKKLRVDQAMLLRIIRNYVHEFGEYSQAIPMVASILTCAMSELEAYYCLKEILHFRVLTYFQNQNIGCVYAQHLAHDVLKFIDSDLAEWLETTVWHNDGNHRHHWLSTELLPLFTHCYSLEAVFLLWDFFISHGFHMSLLCMIAHMIRHREEFLELRDKNESLQKLHHIMNFKERLTVDSAKMLIKVSCMIAKLLPPMLYSKVVRHVVGDIPNDILVKYAPV